MAKTEKQGTAQAQPNAPPEPYNVWERKQLAREVAEARDNPLDETIPGGKYVLADGREVNANGEPVGKASKASHPAKPEETPKKKAESETEEGGDDYDDWTKDELQEEVESRDLEVTGSGSNGAVVKSDLIDALRKDDKGG